MLKLEDSKTGPRSIPLNERAKFVLEQIVPRDNNPYVIAGKNPSSYLVNLRKPWKIVCERAQLQGVRIHDLRHTFASLGIAADVSLYEISKLLGHASVTTTQRYAHLSQGKLAESSNKIASFL